MASAWPSLSYETWRATCDTLHAHAQVLGKLAVVLAPPEPELQHAALHVTARGWETLPLPAPNRSGSFVALLDLHAHEAAVEHSDGRSARVPLTPNRSVAEVTRGVLGAVADLAGPVTINMTPQETAWSTPLDEDTEHATYDTAHVGKYLAAATRVVQVLAALRAPFRGRSTPVNAWWGSFDLAVTLFSGLPADPQSPEFIARNSMDAQDMSIGWWPGDSRYPQAAFYAYAHPSPAGLANGVLSPPAARFDETLGEFILDWDRVVGSDDPFATALDFGRSFVRHACTVCEWDPTLLASLDGVPPPVR